MNQRSDKKNKKGDKKSITFFGGFAAPPSSVARISPPCLTQPRVLLAYIEESLSSLIGEGSQKISEKGDSVHLGGEGAKRIGLG